MANMQDHAVAMDSDCKPLHMCAKVIQWEKVLSHASSQAEMNTKKRRSLRISAHITSNAIVIVVSAPFGRRAMVRCCEQPTILWG